MSEEDLQIVEKKRSKRQSRQGKIYPTECRIPKNSMEIRKPLKMNNTMKQRKIIEWERLENSKKLSIKGTFHAKMGTIKDRNGKDLTETEEIKKRWQEYTEEL